MNSTWTSRRLALLGAVAAAAGLTWSCRRADSSGTGSASGGASPAPANAPTGTAAAPVAEAAGAADGPLVQEGQTTALFWNTRLERPDGSTGQMAEFRGKPLLVNFWATWCPPCVREMPLIERTYRSWSPKGLQVLGVAVDSPSPVKAYLEKTPVGFSIAVAGATGSDFGRRLGNRQGGLPYSVLLDAQGKLVAQHVGELDAATLDRWMQGLSW